MVLSLYPLQSPDIIPADMFVLTEDELIKSYDKFIGAAVVPGQENKIYVRALAVPPSASSSAAEVNLTAVPSELILWPQVWKDGESLKPDTVVLESRGEGKGKLLHSQYHRLPYAHLSYSYC
jgi:hypothetical protein